MSTIILKHVRLDFILQDVHLVYLQCITQQNIGNYKLKHTYLLNMG